MKNRFKNNGLDRREFLKKSMVTMGALSALPSLNRISDLFMDQQPAVSIVRIKNDRIYNAVKEAVDLLGGISEVTKNCQKIMLKPNLVSDDPNSTTKLMVIKALATLMKSAGKEVMIGEGSAAAAGINADENGIYYTHKPELLNKLQQQVFDKLGYTELARELNVDLINLHTGKMVDIEVPDAHHFKTITLHHSLKDIDLLCSVPMMKTHSLATVTLGLKNLIGLYPGSAYCSVRSCVHNEADQAGSPSIAFEILDMAKANKLGLTVIDASTAMEGEGPSSGQLVKMNLIIAGTDPLATDMVAAATMGFEPHEVPAFSLAHQSGLTPATLDDIEIRGESIDAVQRKFVRANVVPWKTIKDFFGAKEV